MIQNVDKRCSLCKVPKPVSAFYRRSDRAGSPYMSQCKECYTAGRKRTPSGDKRKRTDKPFDNWSIRERLPLADSIAEGPIRSLEVVAMILTECGYPMTKQQVAAMEKIALKKFRQAWLAGGGIP